MQGHLRIYLAYMPADSSQDGAQEEPVDEPTAAEEEVGDCVGRGVGGLWCYMENFPHMICTQIFC